MAEPKSKFAAIFEQRAEPEGPPPVGRVENAAAPAPRPIGRPPGKRSDPEWKQFSILLRRDTQREAADLLRVQGGSDLSGLMQKLLETWVKKQRA